MKGDVVEQTPMRAAIIRRMSASKREVPHFYVQTDVEVGALREQLSLSSSGARITFTAPLAVATARSLREHPQFNSVWTQEGLMRIGEINLGIAVSVEDGLLAPAILGADRLDVRETALALADLTARARAGRLRSQEFSDATFTLSNLGMFDVSAFTAIVVPPQVAILATGRPRQMPALDEGRLCERSVMTVTLSADHRAVDGADAARFLETFKRSVEDASHLFSSPKEAGS